MRRQLELRRNLSGLWRQKNRPAGRLVSGFENLRREVNDTVSKILALLAQRLLAEFGLSLAKLVAKYGVSLHNC